MSDRRVHPQLEYTEMMEMSLPVYDDAALVRGNLVQQTMHKIVDLIRTQQLAVGDQLPSEGELAEELGVSRTVVREAIRGLAVLGIADVGNGRRPKVAATTAFPFVMSLAHSAQTGQITVQQIWEARSCIEVRTAMLAASLRTDQQAARIMELAQQMESCEDHGPQMTRLEIEFHHLIAIASQNILFEHLLASFAPLMASAVPAAWSTRTTPSAQSEVVDNHVQIALAIMERNPKRAAKAMELHFERAIRYLVQARYKPPFFT